MFDLEKAIAEWRRQLTTSGLESPEALDELESHLRDKIESHMQTGTGEDRAYNEALKEIGDNVSLSAEFIRSSGDIWTPLSWIFYGAIVVGLSAYYHFNQVPWNERVHGFLVVGLWIATVFCWLHIARRLPAMPYPRLRRCIKLSVACLAVYCCGSVFPSIIGQFASQDFSVPLWSGYLTFLLLLVGDGIGLSERDRAYLRAASRNP